MDDQQRSAEAPPSNTLPVVTTKDDNVRSSMDSASTKSDIGMAGDVEKNVNSGTEQELPSQTVADWDGPDDPGNPMNWSMAKKSWYVIVIGLQGWLVTFGTSVYTSGYPQVASDFSVSRVAALLGLSLYTLGLAFGPVIAAPLSETFGRWVVYAVSLPISALFTLGAGFSHNLAALLACRFFAGMIGGPTLAIGGGTIADLFPPRQRAVASSCFIAAPFLGPATGPIVGGFVAQYENWRWTQWVILFAAGPITLLTWFTTKETYKKVLLQRRAKALKLPPPDQPGPSGLKKLKFILTVTVLRPVHMTFSEPIVLFLGLYSAFTFGVLFIFFAAFPLVFVGIYGFTVSQTGLSFIGIGIGILVAIATNILIDRRIYQKQVRQSIDAGKAGLVPPEHRLYTAMLGGFSLTIGLFWFAWTARVSVHWISPIIASVFFAWGNFGIFTATAMYTVDVYGPLNGASGLAANGMMRYGFGAVFPLFTVQMYHAMGVAWATSLLAFVSILFLPIPFVLFKWGPEIRKKSHYDTVKF